MQLKECLEGHMGGFEERKGEMLYLKYSLKDNGKV